ncbi:MAG: hypothetical protein R2748_35305 [Bryobacterales bacterium]
MRLLSAAILLALAVACSKPAPELKIADILADPSLYEEQTVELSGEVTDAFGLFSTGLYTLADETGEINVVTTAGLPAAGAKLTVRGTVLSGVTVGGKHYGVTLNEQERGR